MSEKVSEVSGHGSGHTAQTASMTARQLYGPGQARPEGIEHNLGRAARLVRPYVGTLEPRGRLWRPMFTG